MEGNNKVKKDVKNQRPRKNKAKSVAEPKKKVETDSEDEGELCFICTEPIVTFAVSQCDHRTCHRCTLRLRALYETRNCAYCKAEQKVVIFTKDGEKSFDQYSEQDTPFTDKKLGIKFETQEMYKDAKSMMEFNCPQKECEESFKNWLELKHHVRKSHNLNICDLCSRHKKIFPYEHTLYTSAQLTKHHREGDKEFNSEDETGFSGHPECAFCKTRFFGDDELFIHCRDRHEQCFICVRNGQRHEYYADYTCLEDHFKSDHSLCLYPQCLEKKFVVFDSPIDLKAHEVEVHGESIAGLQRSMQTDARKLELNFQYESYRSQQQQQRGNNNNNNNNNNGASGSNSNRRINNNNNNNSNGKKKEETKPINKSSTTQSSTSVLSGTDFPSINSVPEVPKNQPRIVPGASTKKGKGKALQKPAGFGGLSSAPSSSTTTTTNVSSSSSSSNAGSSQQNDAVVASHAAFLSRVADMLKSNEKVSEFRSLTSAFRKNTLGGENYVNKVVQLTNNSVEKSAKIFKGVEDLLDVEDKKRELIRVWRNKQATMSHFPALDVREKAISPQPSRVLVIKGPKPVNRVVGAKGSKDKTKNVWDKVASAAKVATAPTNSSSSSSSSKPSSLQNSPQSSRPSSPSNTFRTPSKTPWSGSGTSRSSTGSEFPSLKPKAFPSLPTAAPKHQMILNMRKTTTGPKLGNAWGAGSGEEGDDSAAEDSSSSTSSNTKKKGRKNKVLFRVGL